MGMAEILKGFSGPGWPAAQSIHGPRPEVPMYGAPGTRPSDFGLTPQQRMDRTKAIAAWDKKAAELESAKGMSGGMGMLALAQGLLAGSSNTPRPVSIGQGLAAGLPGMLQQMRQGPRDYMANEMGAMKMQDALTARQTAAASLAAVKKWQGELPEGHKAKGLPPQMAMKVYFEEVKAGYKEGKLKPGRILSTKAGKGGKTEQVFTQAFGEYKDGMWTVDGKPLEEGQSFVPKGVAGTGDFRAWKKGTDANGNMVYVVPRKDGEGFQTVQGVAPIGGSILERALGVMDNPNVKPNSPLYSRNFVLAHLTNVRQQGAGGEFVDKPRSPIPLDRALPTKMNGELAHSVKAYRDAGYEPYLDGDGVWKARDIGTQPKALTAEARSTMKAQSKKAVQSLADIDRATWLLNNHPGIVGIKGGIRGIFEWAGEQTTDSPIQGPVNELRGILERLGQAQKEEIIGKGRRGESADALIKSLQHGEGATSSRAGALAALKSLRGMVSGHESVRQESLYRVNRSWRPPTAHPDDWTEDEYQHYFKWRKLFPNLAKRYHDGLLGTK